MKLRFELRFHSRWGQQFFVSGNLPALGNDDPSHALPLQYHDEETWTAELEVDGHGPVTLRYHYILRDDRDKSSTAEWGKERLLTLKAGLSGELRMVDYWNDAAHPANAFLTAPFTAVLLKRTRDKTIPFSEAAHTHIFRVKAPRLEKNEALCLLGSAPSMGNWDTGHPLLMSDADFPWWTIRLDLSAENRPCRYKYGIYDREKRCFLRFEEGEDRALTLPVAGKTLTIMTDGFARFPVSDWKGTGAAVPVFSLRSSESMGVGEFADLRLLADWAAKTGMKMIQLLPVNDTTATHTWKDSYPYAAISAFALHPIYLRLQETGKLDASHPLQRKFRSRQEQLNAPGEVDYEAVLQFKWDYIRALFARQREAFPADEDFRAFFEENRHWLAPYAAFCYLRDKYHTADFNSWPQYSVYEEAAVTALTAPAQPHYPEILLHYFVQYHLHKQLREAVQYIHDMGIVLKGDIPIGIYRHSVDAWMRPGLYHLDMQAGAPPDAFAVKGQNWGFPTYDWERMEEDGFAWWKQRFCQMSLYFDAFRIDHILGFFRIWQIPLGAVEGVLGYFNPALPVTLNELIARKIGFDHERFCRPYITDGILQEFFGADAAWIADTFLDPQLNGRYRMKPAFDTQRQIERFFRERKEAGQELSGHLRIGLFDLISNVLLLEVPGSNGALFHPRYGLEYTPSFLELDKKDRDRLYELSVDYFHNRQEEVWRQQALRILPSLKRTTGMLICGEDLGTIPHCVPAVMKALGILPLEIQRMPKRPAAEFFHPKDASYLSVVSPSTHDMSTIRGWWEEDRVRTQRFYNMILRYHGAAPYFCEPWIVKDIIQQHLQSPAMWTVIQLQDILGMAEHLRRENPHDERINVPADADHFWCYRLHVKLEQLLTEDAFNEELRRSIRQAGRG